MTSVQERFKALVTLLGGDEAAVRALLKELRKTHPGLGIDLKAAGDVRMALKQTQPAGPLDAALDRLRAALEQARQRQGDAELVKLLDSFATSLKPTASGRQSPGHLRDTDKPATKEMGDPLVAFTDWFLMTGARR